MMKKNFLFMLLLICMLGGCKDEKHDSVLNLFSESQQLFQEKENLIKDEFLAVIEGMTCNEEYLIVYDLHSGDSYTLFDRKTGAYITRFGTIGQGPGEIPAGCYGYMLNKCFSVFDNQTRVVMKYKLDALRSDKTDGEYKTVEGLGTPRDYTQMTKEEIREAIKAAGIVGMGGAGFPTHVKLTPKDDGAIDYVIVNGAECEPYLTSDYRMMLEEPERIVTGLKA